MRVLPVGAHALMVEVADTAAAQWLHRRVRELADDPSRGLGRPRDVVPAARTVLLDGLDDPASWSEALGRLRPSVQPVDDSVPVDDAALVVIRVVYDGPDLADVAAAWGCATDEVVRRHLDSAFTVAFCGFAPGFAYCTAATALPSTPRRHEPRARLRAGAVGLADSFTAVYPRAMPGGWQVIGHTDAVVFDPDRERPALLAPGDRVRFEVAP